MPSCPSSICPSRLRGEVNLQNASVIIFIFGMELLLLDDINHILKDRIG